MRRAQGYDDQGPAVMVVTDVTLQCDREGRHRALHTAGRYESWAPYVSAFGHINLIARVHSGRDGLGPVADGPGVDVLAVPRFSGRLGLVLAVPRVWSRLRRIGRSGDLWVGRLPEPLSILAYVRARRSGGRFLALVVVGTDDDRLPPSESDILWGFSLGSRFDISSRDPRPSYT